LNLRYSALRFAAGVLGAITFVVLLTPFIIAVAMSFSHGVLLEMPRDRLSWRWYAELANDLRWRDSMVNSLEVALMSAILATLSGVALALGQAHIYFRGQRLLSGAALLPLFTPSVVLGIGLLPLFHLLGLAGSKMGLALAHALVSLPVVFLMVRSALRETDRNLERAARGLGAGPLRAFYHVTWPLIRSAIGSAALFSFVLSFNEFTLALFLTAPESETLPRAIWPELRYSLSPLVAAASTASVVLTLLGLGVAAGLRRLTLYLQWRAAIERSPIDPR
jgi:putative spermidine/putrescine transport system permease protein